MSINIFLEKSYFEIIYWIVLDSAFLCNKILGIDSVFQYKARQHILSYTFPVDPPYSSNFLLKKSSFAYYH